MLIWFHAALDGQNRLKFYWIDLIDSARWQLEDLALATVWRSFLTYLFLTYLFFSMPFQLEGVWTVYWLNWVAFAWIPNYDDALAPDRPAEGRESLKYNYKEYEHQCLSLVFKDWDQKTAQAVDVSWEGTIQVSDKTKFYVAALGWGEPHDPVHGNFVKFNEVADSMPSASYNPLKAIWN